MLQASRDGKHHSELAGTHVQDGHTSDSHRTHERHNQAVVCPVPIGKVFKVMDFGAFVNFFGPKDGLVHVSQMKNERVKHPSDVVAEGDEVFVKLLGFDDRGKVKLSMKRVDQETGADLEAAAAETAE